MEDLETSYCTSGELALEYLSKNEADIVVSDLKMDGMTGLDLLEAIKKDYPAIEVIIMTAYATQKTAIQALKSGANDYLIKPFEMDELIIRLRRIQHQQQLLRENKRLKKSQPTIYQVPKIVGKSARMRDVYRLIQKASQNDANVLVRGESGTGKELVASAIHDTSPRTDQAFVTVNCAALPENLLESELFGYEKGAFTGATQRRIGKFEQAAGGTIFLDEIGDMSLSTQAKMLRVLQNKEIYRLGGNQRIEVDVRIVAATHQNLEEMVEANTFRNDLYYRLNVFSHHLTPPSRSQRRYSRACAPLCGKISG